MGFKNEDMKSGVLVYTVLCGILSAVLLCSCQSNAPVTSNSSKLLLEKSRKIKALGEASSTRRARRQDSLSERIKQQEYLTRLSDTSLVNIKQLASGIVLDLKYATVDNFLKTAVYPCAKCYVRGAVAKALLKVNEELARVGYTLQFYDCYRPHDVQKKMWKIVSDPGYVADPKGGSVHNKGAAVDVTLVRLNGAAVDMGTPFDYFGKKAHHSYRKLSKDVLNHRKILRKVMEKYGFGTIRKEWWHYNFKKTRKQFKMSNFVWECE